MSESFVVDASVAAKWLFDEDDSGLAATLRTRRLFAPELLWLECGSVIWNRMMRGVLSPVAVPGLLEHLDAAPVESVSMKGQMELVLRLAVRLRHPVYDCSYLALAIVRDVRAVTADQRFVRSLSQHPDLAERVVPLGHLAH